MAFNLYPPWLIAVTLLWSQTALADAQIDRYFPADAAQGFPPPQPIPTYSPSVPPTMPQTMNVKGLSVEDESKKNDERPKRRVRRYSAHRLRREKVPVPAESTLSIETHRGQLMVRVEQSVDR